MTQCESDLRPGGKYRQVLRDPAGNEFAFSGEFLEVFEPIRVMSTWKFEGIPGEPAIVTTMFREVGGQTEVWMRTVFPSGEHKAGWAASGGERRRAAARPGCTRRSTGWTNCWRR